MMTFLQTMEHDDSSDSVDISMMKNGIAPDYPPPHSDGITIVCLSIGVSSTGSTLYKESQKVKAYLLSLVIVTDYGISAV